VEKLWNRRGEVHPILNLYRGDTLNQGPGFPSGEWTLQGEKKASFFFREASEKRGGVFFKILEGCASSDDVGK